MSRLPIIASLISVSILTGCASPDSISIRHGQEQNCARVHALLKKPAAESLPQLQEIALSQNADVLLRNAKVEQYQSIARLLRHLQLGFNSTGIPLSLSGMLKLVTEVFKNGNPESDPELRELHLLLLKARESVIRKLSDSLHELQAEREKLAAAEIEQKTSRAEMVAANFIAKIVPTLPAQEKADKAQKAYAKSGDEVTDRKQKIESVRIEILQLAGCLDRQIAAK